MAHHTLSYTAHYARTRNGTWGVRITGKPVENAATGDDVDVQVKRKNGEVNTHRVNIFRMGNNRCDEGKAAAAGLRQADSQSGTAKRSHHAEPEGSLPFHGAWYEHRPAMKNNTTKKFRQAQAALKHRR